MFTLRNTLLNINGIYKGLRILTKVIDGIKRLSVNCFMVYTLLNDLLATTPFFSII